MAKNAVTDWSTTAGSNTDVGGVDIQGTAAASNMDNALREIMEQIAVAITNGDLMSLVYESISAGHTVATTDKAQLFDCTAALELELPTVATAGAGFFFIAKANGGDVTLDPNGTENINGSSTSVVVSDGASALVVCNGSAWFTITIGSGNVTTTGTQTLTNKTLTSPTINTPTISGGAFTGGTDITVADGGTGRSTATAYAVVCGGTTSTGAHQSIASVGTSGQALVSNGAGALPTFQTLDTFANGLTLIDNVATTSGGTASLTDIPTTYRALLLVFNAVSHNSGSDRFFRVAYSSNNGSSYGTARQISETNSAGGTGLSGTAMLYNTGITGTSKISIPMNFHNGSLYATAATETVVTGLIDAIQFSPSSGSFDSGSIGVYGIS